jgi:uncharacterized membrane protein YkvA (DUF1232 family)
MSDNDKTRFDDALRRGAGRIDDEDVRKAARSEEAVRRKLEGSSPGFIEKAGAKIEIFISAIRDYSSGNYKDVPWLTIALCAFAVLYFLNPADIIPDVIPLGGFIDDAGVIAAAYAAVMRDLTRYEKWKKDQDTPERG